ncbi:hypothetical protein [Rhizobium oryzicola]|uniref:DUF1515 domain-containing protein n=1 Tax=Rhizobium oryzicola TaxID=1232668 RepID=A0ABT8SVH1_9HYPH|nr:hypothetical protein [Rhizobium oryzicola]MDO1582444.1 hypothetical protein [Rhizobium oryzicola]
MGDAGAQQLDLIVRMLERLERRMDDMESSARESRGRMHQRLDDQAASIAELRTDFEVAATIAEQQRQGVEALAEKHFDTAKAIGERIDKLQPDIDQWRQMRKLGYGFSGLLVALGISGSAFIVYLGETARAIARKWLGV